MRTILVIPELKFNKNMIASIRTAEAFGVTELCFIGNPNLSSWKIQHITKGGLKHIPKKKFTHIEECINYLIGERINIVCIENIENAHTLGDYKFPANVALIMGHESLGVDKELLKYDVVRIPQYGLMRCLNTSVAMSIVLWERFKQRLLI